MKITWQWHWTLNLYFVFFLQSKHSHSPEQINKNWSQCQNPQRNIGSRNSTLNVKLQCLHLSFKCTRNDAQYFFSSPTSKKQAHTKAKLNHFRHPLSTRLDAYENEMNKQHKNSIIMCNIIKVSELTVYKISTLLQKKYRPWHKCRWFIFGWCIFVCIFLLRCARRKQKRNFTV